MMIPSMELRGRRHTKYRHHSGSGYHDSNNDHRNEPCDHGS